MMAANNLRNNENVVTTIQNTNQRINRKIQIFVLDACNRRMAEAYNIRCSKMN
jgi:hypothetical protein